MEQTKTFFQICEDRQLNVASVGRKYVRRYERPFDRHSIPTQTEYSDIFGETKTPTKTKQKTISVPETVFIQPQIIEIVPAETVSEDTDKKEDTPTTKPKERTGWQTLGLILLMLLPVFGSFQNIYVVTGHLMDTWVASMTFTILFSVAPFVLTWVGVGRVVRFLVVPVLMIWEGFCNLTRIYAGLINFDQNAFPNRFLQLTCDIFDSGTKGTALALSGIMAALALVIFFAGYIGLNKK